MEKYGYEEISKVAFFGLAFGEAVYGAVKEATPVQKTVAFISCADEAIGLLSIDRELLMKEWEDFSLTDRAALLADCSEKFDLADDDLEHKIEGAIGAAFKILDGIQGAVELWKEIA